MTLLGELTSLWGRLQARRCLTQSFGGISKNSRTEKPTVYPELHSKGAVGRHCAAALRLVIRDMGQWAPTGSHEHTPHFDFVWELIRNLAAFYDCLHCFGQLFTEAEAKETHDYLANVGVFQQALCNVFMVQGRKLFHLTEKAHYSQHIALDCILLRYNPRFGWTYSDEDYMGKIAQIAKASTRARGPLRLGHALVFC